MTDQLTTGATALLLRAAARGAAGVVHVARDEPGAERLARVLAVLAPEIETVVLPPWDCLPYDRASPSREVMGRRMTALRRIEARAERPIVVVTTADSVLQRVPPRGAMPGVVAATGAAIDVDAFHASCLAVGYVDDERVDEAGEIAVRGEVIDIFPAETGPVRIQIEGGRIEAIRTFDPLTQRTLDEVGSVTIDPASELPPAEDADADPSGAEHWLPTVYPALDTLFDRLPGATLILQPGVEGRAAGTLAQIGEAYRDSTRADRPAGQRAPLAPERLYLTAGEWAAHTSAARTLGSDGFEAVPTFATASRPERALAEFVAAERARGHRIVIAAAHDGDRLAIARRAARGAGISLAPAADWDAVLAAEPGSILTIAADLDAGFVEADARVTAISSRDVLGSRARGGDDPAVIAPWQIEGEALHIGDTVVHVDHGVGVLRGLDSVATADGTGGEAIRLEYAGGAVQLTPVEGAGRLWRYGSEEGAVALDRLGTDGWAKRRAGIAAEITQTARTLVTLAAEREALAARAIVAPAAAYERFVAGFPFAETADQRSAIADVLADLASGRPMDRLVVGDVGFGKTEVALRAAAAAALAGRQVAVVAPTTVLARQHFGAFTRRFEGTGIEVAQLSRLVEPAEAKRVKAGLADGSIGVVVGTHALAGDSVGFKDLALLVVDEEQRFGTAHKARLRALGESVHVLTLTATPIPRTLQTALVGLQDLSPILTAPARRRPIRTFVAPLDPATIKVALTREKRRGGQSFVVVPRIEDIEPALAELGALVPGLDVRIAHGKLPAREVDEAMVRFADGRGDVLLATSLIESGLDVPRANTMIVRRAELFGLAQLHQLRGRVGRGRAQGICHLFTDPEAPLPEATAKRLGTLAAFDRLGAGMAISARDLDLRGAGDLTGDDQAGHMKLIGLGLYQDLLAAALREARGEPVDDWTTEFQTDAAGGLPDTYVPEPELRIGLYHRLARATTAADVDALADEITDRFGPPPPEVGMLLATAGARAAAHALGVRKIVAGPQAVALSFGPAADPQSEHADVFARLADLLVWKGDRMVYRRASATPAERVTVVRELLDALA